MTTLAASALTVRFGQGERGLTAVDRVDLELPEGATVGLVGESGSGKSTLARALSGSSRSPAGRSSSTAPPFRSGTAAAPSTGAGGCR